MKIGDLVRDIRIGRVGVVTDPALIHDYHGMVIVVLWSNGEKGRIRLNNVEAI
tara:strand:- start:940 stop:1098 length:159 start_codon:yes stop_codon:yes gene_type:complete